MKSKILFSWLGHRFRSFSNITITCGALQPYVADAKMRATAALEHNSSDIVLHNVNSSSGITDLAFENRENEFGVKKSVSIYFKMDPEGVQAYQKAATVLSETIGVDLSYTPHLGQSRITLEWDPFWTMLNNNSLGFVSPPVLLRLQQGKSNEMT